MATSIVLENPNTALVSNERAIFKELFYDVGTSIISQINTGALSEQAAVSALIGAMQMCMDKAFAKKSIDKDIEVKQANIDLLTAQKLQYLLYPKIKKCEFLSNMTGLAMTNGLSSGDTMVSTTLNTINALDAVYTPPF